MQEMAIVVLGALSEEGGVGGGGSYWMFIPSLNFKCSSFVF